MSTLDSFDLARYIRAPQLDVATALTFGHKLLAVAPPKPIPPVKKSLTLLKGTIHTLQVKWSAVDQHPRITDRRPIDVAADNGWGAFIDRLTAYARLPADRYPHAARAAELLESYFSTGATFLKLDYHSQWAEMHKRVERMKAEGLRPEFERLVGADFMTELFRTYDDYGLIVGVKPGHTQTPDAPALQRPLRAFSEAAGNYGLQLVAWHEDGDEDVKTAVRAALAPFDEVRAAQPRRTVATEPTTTTAPPSTPAPVAAEHPVAAAEPVA